MIDFDTYITAPIYYRVVRRCGTQWHFVKGETFYNPLNLPKPSLDSLFATFGTSLRSCAAKLLSINGGEEGFYLVDIMNKRYYYCGKSIQDIKSKLLELGIGRPDPHI
ncbi:hypothetical protein NIES4071_32560 [Calothrix sp. NIES-4071]|nr:hypothetical protein NIES4071_32560 [Calothrix sp. NIES-4071]BAZ57576.1 hypothetical protein NIES4105_32500 [Calothrix sp. NIES-4105]